MTPGRKRGLADRPEDFGTVVGQHWASSIAYLQASRQPCIKIRDDEVGKIGDNRNLVAIGPGDLDQIDRSRTWVLGVILCPGDNASEVTSWVRKHRVNPGHVWFFLHSNTDMAALQPWADAGYPTNQVDFVADWAELHPVLGLYLSDYIYEANGPSHKRTWTTGRRPQA